MSRLGTITSFVSRQNWSQFIIPGTADRGEGQIAVEEKVLRISIPNTYLAAPFRLLLGAGPIGLHQVQIDD